MFGRILASLVGVTMMSSNLMAADVWDYISDDYRHFEVRNDVSVDGLRVEACFMRPDFVFGLVTLCEVHVPDRDYDKLVLLKKETGNERPIRMEFADSPGYFSCGGSSRDVLWIDDLSDNYDQMLICLGSSSSRFELTIYQDNRMSQVRASILN